MATKEELQELEAQVSKGLKKAHKKMVELKKFKKIPVVVSNNGKAVKIKAEDL